MYRDKLYVLLLSVKENFLHAHIKQMLDKKKKVDALENRYLISCFEILIYFSTNILFTLNINIYDFCITRSDLQMHLFSKCAGKNFWQVYRYVRIFVFIYIYLLLYSLFNVLFFFLLKDNFQMDKKLLFYSKVLVYKYHR